MNIICPVCNRAEWTGANHFEVLPDGNILICFSKINTIAVIDRSTGNITKQWGCSELAHPQSCTQLNNGNVLLLDSGAHSSGLSMGFSRLLEVDMHDGKLLWVYTGTPWVSFFSCVMGSCQQLPDYYDFWGGTKPGNILTCEATKGRIFEIARNGEMLWEYISPDFYETPRFGRTNMISHAYRYSFDYEGLRRSSGNSDKNTRVNETKNNKGIQTVGERVHSRLEHLGYQ
jgi:hypothetical protein